MQSFLENQKKTLDASKQNEKSLEKQCTFLEKELGNWKKKYELDTKKALNKNLVSNLYNIYIIQKCFLLYLLLDFALSDIKWVKNCIDVILWNSCTVI